MLGHIYFVFLHSIALKPVFFCCCELDVFEEYFKYRPDVWIGQLTSIEPTSGKYPLSGQNLKHIHCWILQQLHSLFAVKKVNGQ